MQRKLGLKDGFDELACSACHKTKAEGHAPDCPHLLAPLYKRVEFLESLVAGVGERLVAAETELEVLKTVVLVHYPEYANRMRK